MGRTLQEKLAALPPERVERIQARADELITEEITLRDLRHALELTQATLAQSLDIGQDGVSRIEKRSDLLISTLSRYIDAMGGHLKLIVEFKDRPPVTIAGLGDILPEADIEVQAKESV